MMQGVVAALEASCPTAPQLSARCSLNPEIRGSSGRSVHPIISMSVCCVIVCVCLYLRRVSVCVCVCVCAACMLVLALVRSCVRACHGAGAPHSGEPTSKASTSPAGIKPTRYGIVVLARVSTA
jgi:hypothetical protein